MAAHKYYLIDTSRGRSAPMVPTNSTAAGRVIRSKPKTPVVALSERALRKALEAGWL